MENGVIVVRPRKVPPRLGRLAAESGRSPTEYLAETIRQHPTYAAAADHLGVTRLTLSRWIRWAGIKVVSA